MSFVYTMQEIEPRNRRLLVTSLIAGLGVLLVWLIWFVAAPISFYEVSDAAQIDEVGRIEANFDPAIQNMFQPGQDAAFQSMIAGGQVRQFRARFVAVEQETGRAYFVLENPSLSDRALLIEGLTGSVRIVLYQQTPLQIVLQAIGTST